MTGFTQHVDYFKINLTYDEDDYLTRDFKLINGRDNLIKHLTNLKKKELIAVDAITERVKEQGITKMIFDFSGGFTYPDNIQKMFQINKEHIDIYNKVKGKINKIKDIETMDKVAVSCQVIDKRLKEMRDVRYALGAMLHHSSRDNFVTRQRKQVRKSLKSFRCNYKKIREFLTQFEGHQNKFLNKNTINNFNYNFKILSDVLMKVKTSEIGKKADYIQKHFDLNPFKGDFRLLFGGKNFTIQQITELQFKFGGGSKVKHITLELQPEVIRRINSFTIRCSSSHDETLQVAASYKKN